MDTSSLMEQMLGRDNLNAAYLQVVRRRVEIPKPDEGVRNLWVPTVTDRPVQQAIAQVLTSVYKEQFHGHSYGFRPNRCAQQTIITELDRMNDSYDQIVNIDLEKLFDTVSHSELMASMGRTIKDGEVISIIGKFPANGTEKDDEYKESVIGTQQGGSLSSLPTNIIRNELDKEVEQRRLNFVRYADDCINVIGSEMFTKRVMRNTTRFIEEKLGFKINTTKSKVDKPRGIKYLGYRFYFDGRAHQCRVKPHARSTTEFRARVGQLTCQSWGVGNIYRVQKLNEFARGWINYYKIGSMKPICARLDGNIRYRIHVCTWKRWKTPQNRTRNLRKLGASEWAIRRTACAKGYTRVCRTSDIYEAIDNKRLVSFGLISMLDYYTERCVTC